MKRYAFLLLLFAIGAALSAVGTGKGSPGLKYILINEGSEYSVSCGSAHGSKTIIIPSRYNSLPVTEIRGGGFYGCSKLKKIVIPNTIKKIGSNAFRNCYSLRELSLPDSIVEIGTHAFDTCMKLKSIVLPPKLTTVKRGAFYGCLSLEMVTIPAAVRSIEAYAFSGCNIRVVTMKGEVPPRLGATLPFRVKSMKIYLPSRRALRAYSSTRLPWNNYSIFYVVR